MLEQGTSFSKTGFYYFLLPIFFFSGTRDPPDGHRFEFLTHRTEVYLMKNIFKKRREFLYNKQTFAISNASNLKTKLVMPVCS